MSRTVPMGKLVHPCRVKSFRKAVSAVMDDLGIDDKIIENLNLIDMAAKGCIINVCLKVHFLEGDSRGCLW